MEKILYKTASVWSVSSMAPSSLAGLYGSERVVDNRNDFASLKLLKVRSSNKVRPGLSSTGQKALVHLLKEAA